jgi:hypothetical protein
MSPPCLMTSIALADGFELLTSFEDRPARMSGKSGRKSAPRKLVEH